MTDITRSGSRDYDANVRSKVIGAFLQMTQAAHGKGIQVDDLAARAGVPGRTVRQIMTDADGVDFVLGGGDDGYRVAEYREDASALDRRLLNQAKTIMVRLERRESLIQLLPIRQESLF